MKAFKHHPTESMNYCEQFRVKPGYRIQLKDVDPQFADKEEEKKSAKRAIKKLQKRMDELQNQLYAEQKRSLLICLQAPDAGGKDGVVRHVVNTLILCMILYRKQSGRSATTKSATSSDA